MNEFVMQGSFFAHRALTRDVTLLNTIAHRIERLSAPELQQLRKWYQFFWTMMEQHHAAEDDLLFRAVEERLEKPSQIIEVMEVEHNRLQFLIDEIKRLLGELDRNGQSPLLNRQLQFHTAELHKLFLSHIAREEQYIHEKITAHFTKKEQRKIENHVKRKAPVRYLSYMIPWLSDSLSASESKILNASLPYTAKMMNRFFWRKKYRRLVQPVQALVP